MSIQQPPQNDVQFDDELLLSVEDWINCATCYEIYGEEQKYWQVQIPQELQNWAMSESTEEIDERDGRDDESSTEHADQGKRAECAVAAACEEAGVEWEWMHDGYKQGDIRINGLSVDVKSRVQNEGGYMDLLVGCRDEGNTSDIQADIYLQVLVEEEMNSAMITGYALNYQVQDARWFDLAQSYPSKIVDHDDLRDIGDII